MAVGSALAVLLAVPAFANVKHLEINADLDNINEPAAGECFLPEFELDDEDEDRISYIKEDTSDMARENPTVPVTVNVTITSDEEELDDDLTFSGSGIRSTYVDYVSVDNTEAHARLQVYPLYQLVTPTPVISGKTLTWNAVPYAGKYEIVITETKKNGAEETYHRFTTGTSYSLGSNSDTASIGAAVRALPTSDAGYLNANISAEGVASWDNMDGIQNYRVTIKYTDNAGKEHKVQKTVNGRNTLDVLAYKNSAQAGTFKVTVRGIPALNDEKYYNIAISAFGTAGGNVDTSEYDVDDVWEFLSDYDAVTDGYMAGNVAAGTGSLTKPAGASVGTWKRVTYRWQYLISGVPYQAGWLQIGAAWYYFTPDGYMATGWIQDKGRWYYLETKVGATTGVMQANGTKTIDGAVYSFDASGACLNR